MTLEKTGIVSNKNTKNKLWWIKLTLALIISNVFFFILFSADTAKVEASQELTPEGWVEVQFEPQLLTPFQSGKRVLIVQRKEGKKLEGVLQDLSAEVPGRITVLVKEGEASALFFHTSWEVLPYLRKLTLVTRTKGHIHEIRY